MGHFQLDDASRDRAAWNAGKKVGTKRPFTHEQIWAVRLFLDRESRVRDRAIQQEVCQCGMFSPGSSFMT